MRKFAFRSETERQQLIQAVARRMPDMATAFARFAAGPEAVNPYVPGYQEQPDADAHAEQLRGLLDDFLVGVGLGSNPQALLQVEEIIKDMIPVLQHAQQPDLFGRLQQAPSVRPGATAPELHTEESWDLI